MFKPGEKLIAVYSYDGGEPYEILVKGEIYTCIKSKEDNICRTGIRVFIKNYELGFDSGYFESAEKMMFDKEFADKLNNIID